MRNWLAMLNSNSYIAGCRPCQSDHHGRRVWNYPSQLCEIHDATYMHDNIIPMWLEQFCCKYPKIKITVSLQQSGWNVAWKDEKLLSVHNPEKACSTAWHKLRRGGTPIVAPIVKILSKKKGWQDPQPFRVQVTSSDSRENTWIAHVFECEFLRSGKRYRPGQKLKRLGKACSSQSKKNFWLGGADLLWVTL